MGVAITVTVVVVGISSLVTSSAGIIITNIVDGDYVKVSTICPVSADYAAFRKSFGGEVSIMLTQRCLEQKLTSAKVLRSAPSSNLT